MTSEEYIGRVIENNTQSEFKDGKWTVTIAVIERRTKDLEEWDSRKLEAMATDETEAVAFEQASRDLLQLLYENEGSLFKDNPTVHDLEIQDNILGSNDKLL